MKYLLSFLRKINSQIVIFLTATIVVAIAIIVTNQQSPTSENIVINQQSATTENNFNTNNNKQEITTSNYSLETKNSDKLPDNLSPNINSSNPNSDVINNNNLEQNTMNEEQENITEPLKITNNSLADISRIKTYLGHLPYQEGDRQRLVLVGKYYGKERFLDTEAANAFIKMKIDAQNQGINLTIISGFRSIEEQERLFQKQIQKTGSKEVAALLSAPPGYSEHHTGYTLDIGDSNYPDQDLKFTFENMPAYQWLSSNAINYGFELSFPKNNTQGVSFEPWHCRYIGSVTASKIFASAKRLINNY